jgi:hypothetical protein
VADDNVTVIQPPLDAEVVATDEPINVSVSTDDEGGVVVVSPVVSPTTVAVASPATPGFIEVNTGTIGPRGPQGIPGPPGPSGGSGLDIDDVAYVHHQNVATNVWVIVHTLAYTPNITIVDSAGTEQVGDIRYSAQNTIVVTFSGAFSGTAYLT